MGAIEVLDEAILKQPNTWAMFGMYYTRELRVVLNFNFS